MKVVNSRVMDVLREDFNLNVPSSKPRPGSGTREGRWDASYTVTTVG